jgi:hypothetical protein
LNSPDADYLIGIHVISSDSSASVIVPGWIEVVGSANNFASPAQFRTERRGSQFETESAKGESKSEKMVMML